MLRLPAICTRLACRLESRLTSYVKPVAGTREGTFSSLSLGGTRGNSDVLIICRCLFSSYSTETLPSIALSVLITTLRLPKTIDRIQTRVAIKNTSKFRGSALGRRHPLLNSTKVCLRTHRRDTVPCTSACCSFRQPMGVDAH